MVRVSTFIFEQLNENSRNFQLLSSILCAALYPNLVKVLTPDKIYKMGISGAIPKDHSAEELKFKTKTDGFVSFLFSIAYRLLDYDCNTFQVRLFVPLGLFTSIFGQSQRICFQ